MRRLCQLENGVSGSSEGEELLSGPRVISEGSQHATGGSPTARLIHSSHHHTHVSAGTR